MPLGDVIDGFFAEGSLEKETKKKPVSPLASRELQGKKLEVEKNLNLASKKDPDRHAKVIDMSQRHNMDVGFVDRKLEELSPIDQFKDFYFGDFAEKHPKVMDWLGDINNSILAKDQMDEVGIIDDNVLKTIVHRPDVGIEDYPAAIARGAQSGWHLLNSEALFLGMTEGAIDPTEGADVMAYHVNKQRQVNQLMPENVQRMRVELEEKGGNFNKAYRDYSKWYSELREGRVGDALTSYYTGKFPVNIPFVPDLPLNVWYEASEFASIFPRNPLGFGSFMVEQNVRSFPALLSGIGSSRAATLATASLPKQAQFLAGVAAFAAGTFLLEFPTETSASMMEDFDKEGFDFSKPEDIKRAFSPENADLLKSIRKRGVKKGLGTAGVGGLLNLLFPEASFLRAARPGVLAKAVGATVDVAKESIEQVATEGTGELARADFDITQLEPDEMFLEGALGGPTSVVTTAFGANFDNVDFKNPLGAAFDISRMSYRAQKAMNNAKSISNIIQTFKESKLSKRNLESAKTLVQAADEDGTRVHWQTEDFDDIANENDILPADLANELFEDEGASYQDAKNSGGLLHTELADFVVKASENEKVEALVDGARVHTPDAFTFTEAAKEILPQLKPAFDKAAGDVAFTHALKLAEDLPNIPDVALEDLSDTDRQAKEIGGNIRNQLIEAGVDPASATDNSLIWERFFRTLAERYGLSPQESFNRFQPQIQREITFRVLKDKSVDELDIDLNRIRSGDIPSEKLARGETLNEFIRKIGGITPKGEGADVAILEPDRERVAFQRNLIQQAGLQLDEIARRAVESGFLTEENISDLVSAIESEVAKGSPVFSALQENPEALRVREQLLEFEKFLEEIGADVQRMPNDQIRQLLAEKEFGFEQGLDTDVYEQAEGFRGSQVKSRLGRIEINPSGNIKIVLTRNAKRNTFLHETGHAFLEMFSSLADDPNANPDLKKDWEGIKDFLEVKTRQDLKNDEVQERWVENFEAYLLKGKAPSSALRRAFAKFRVWLTDFFRKLKRENLQAELSDEVSEILDRMLATDEEISEVKRGFPVVYPDLESVGITGETADRYARFKADAEAKWRERIDIVGLQDFEAERKKFLKSEEKRITAETIEELKFNKTYVALSALQRGKFIDGEKIEGDLGSVKLSKKLLIERYGSDIIKSLNQRPPVYTLKDTGVDPDAIAEVFGFSSGQGLVLALANAQDPKVVVKTIVDSKMLKEHGDLMIVGDLPNEVRESMYTDERSKQLRWEAKHMMNNDLPLFKKVLQKIAKGRLPTNKEIRRQALKFISKKKVKDIRPNEYQVASRKAARDAANFLANGDDLSAFKSKINELVNHERFLAAKKGKEFSAKIRKFMMKLDDNKTRKVIANASPTFLAAVDEILDSYEFRNIPLKKIRTKETLRKVIKKLEDEGVPHAIPNSVIEEIDFVNYKELSLEELTNVYDAARSLLFSARTQGTILLNQERMEKRAVASSVAGGIIENGKPVNFNKSDMVKSLEQFKNSTKGIYLTPDTIARELDGFRDDGPVQRHILTPIFDAVNNVLKPRQEQEANTIAQIYNDNFTVNELKHVHDKTYIPEIDAHLSTMEMIAVGWNLGTESNVQALLESTNLFGVGRGQPTVTEINIIKDKLKENHWNFIRAVWKHNESFKQEMIDSNIRRTGLPLKVVDPIDVETKFGTFEGGYMTLQYDLEKSARALETSQDYISDLKNSRFFKAHTREGMRIARVGSGGQAVRLDFGVWEKHVRDVVYSLSIGDAVNYVGSVLSNKDVRQALTDTNNRWATEALNLWHKDVAVGELKAGDAISRTFRHLRSAFTLSVLGWNVSTALIQPTGWLQTVASLGSKYSILGAQEIFKGPIFGKNGTLNQTYNATEFMKRRAEGAFSKDIDLVKSQMNKWTFLPPWFRGSFFFMMIKTQQVVDAFTWQGAFLKGKDTFNGNIEKSKTFADREVARSQASGIFSDRSALERGTTSRNIQQSEVIKSFTALSSYMIAKANVAFVNTRLTNFKDPKSVFQWAADMSLLFMIEGLVIAAIRGNWPDDEDDESLYWFAMKEMLRSSTSTLPIMREFSGEIQGFRGGGVLSTAALRVKRFYDQADQGEIDAALIKSAVDVGALFGKYPSTQPNRVIDAWFRSGEEEVPLMEWLVGKPFKK